MRYHKPYDPKAARLAAEAYLQEEMRGRVEDVTSSPPELIACAGNAFIAIAAWERACREYPNRRLVVRWGGHLIRRNFDDDGGGAA